MSLAPIPSNESDSQALLFSLEVAESAEVLLAKRNEFTGQRVMREAPRLAEAVVRLSALDLTFEEIAHALGMSPNTVSRIALACASAVEGYKERSAHQWREVTHLSLGRIKKLLENPDSELTLKELAILAGIGTEKEQLLTGGATQRIEHVEEPPVEPFNRYIESLPALQVVGMGLSGEGSGSKGEAEDGPPGRAAEGGSAAEGADHRDSDGLDTGSDTEGGPA